jgi:hypothetical protein
MQVMVGVVLCGGNLDLAALFAAYSTQDTASASSVWDTVHHIAEGNVWDTVHHIADGLDDTVHHITDGFYRIVASAPSLIAAVGGVNVAGSSPAAAPPAAAPVPPPLSADPVEKAKYEVAVCNATVDGLETQMEELERRTNANAAEEQVGLRLKLPEDKEFMYLNNKLEKALTSLVGKYVYV